MYLNIQYIYIYIYYRNHMQENARKRQTNHCYEGNCVLRKKHNNSHLETIQVYIHVKILVL